MEQFILLVTGSGSTQGTALILVQVHGGSVCRNLPTDARRDRRSHPEMPIILRGRASEVGGGRSGADSRTRTSAYGEIRPSRHAHRQVMLLGP